MGGGKYPPPPWVYKGKGSEGVLEIWNDIPLYLYLYFACPGVCLFFCLYLSNKSQNGWTDRAQIFCGTSRDPKEGLWMIKFSKICLHQNSIFEIFENPRNSFLKIREIFCFFYLLTRRSPVYFIFTNEIKYRREAT